MADVPLLSNPMTAAGDTIVGGASGAPTRLPKGTDGQVYTLVSGAPAWADPTGGGAALYDPDAAPASGTTWTDEFDDSSLDASWTWDTAPSGTVSESTYPGFLYLTGGSDASATVRHLRRAFVPGATAFSVAAKMNLAMENGNFSNGLMLRILDSSDGLLWQVFIGADGTTTASDGYRVISTASTWATLTAPLITAPQYFLITRSAANVYKGYVSANGIVWQYLGTSTVATAVAKVAIGYGVDTDAVDGDATVDFVRVFSSETKKIGS